MIFLDTETCGFHGVPILLQWAKDDGEIHIHSFWKSTVEQSINLLENICNHDICGFNLTFDWFHLYKIYTMLIQMEPSEYPEDYLERNKYKLMDIEKAGRDCDFCLKPRSACDLYLHAKSGEFQYVMDRKPIKIRRVPAILAKLLKEELQNRIDFDDILFSKRKKKMETWEVEDIKDQEGNLLTTDFQNVIIRFAPSASLKALGEHVLGYDVTHFEDIEIDPRYYPVELGYAPYAKAILDLDEWPTKSEPASFKFPYHGTWPFFLIDHINHWEYNSAARKYAVDDVELTRKLHKYLGSPQAGDDNSELACSVACIRWRGLSVDTDLVKNLKEKSKKEIRKVPTAPRAAKEYIKSALIDDEKILFESLGDSTKRVILEEIATWKGSEAGSRAAWILDARKAEKRIEMYDKLITADRLHPSFNVIGSLSSRMSGRDGLNPHGFNKLTEVRECFIFKWPGFNLGGGDFHQFEITIYAALVNDDIMNKALLENKSLHAMYATLIYPGKTYEDVMASKGTAFDMYKGGKGAMFATIYGGEGYTLHTRLGIPLSTANAAFEGVQRMFPGIFKRQRDIYKNYCPLKQPDGIGSRVLWDEPKNYISSLLGFKRYFDLEFRVCKSLYALGESPPKNWRDIEGLIKRSKDRVQTIGGATQSAVFGAAFAVQGTVSRAASNHEIQSTGAEITKKIQRRIWDLQPSGAHPWIVLAMNMHDEIPTVVRTGYEDKVADVVNTTIEELKEYVPFLSINWKKDVANWSEV
jgi:DNA polymerase I-like protein with 3'-5' exonuclease and polymerase domains